MRSRMSGRVWGWMGAIAVGSGYLTPAAVALTVPLGAAQGGVAVYYNDNGDGETPTNQAYVRAQVAENNANGATFNFSSSPLPGLGGGSFRSLFQVLPDQFGLDVVLMAPTADGSVTPAPFIAVDNSAAGSVAAGPVTWAISSYLGVTPGPADPNNQPFNSLIRGGSGTGDGVTLTVTPVELNGTVYTASVAGAFVSDGLVHWHGVGIPDSPMAALELTGRVFFHGRLSYDSATETTPNLVDFYAGTLELDAEVLCGVRYVDAALGLDTFAGGRPNYCRDAAMPCKTVVRALQFSCPGDVVSTLGSIVPTRVRVRGMAAAHDTSRLQVVADFHVDPQPFDASQPITFAVTEASPATLTRGYTFAVGECSALGSGAGRIRCRSSDGTAAAQFTAKGAGLWRMQARLRAVELAGPFSGPVTVVLNHNGTQTHVGAIGDCRPSRNGLFCNAR
jgi:hypothetical protein